VEASPGVGRASSNQRHSIESETARGYLALVANEATTREANESIPIFPLPSVVLFPAVDVPLYIFEPRYRQMTADAISGAQRIGMVTVDPRHVEEMGGNPPVFEIGCEGEVRNSEARPDGTYQILLHGIRRFRIRREIWPEGDRLYRSAEIEALEDQQPTLGDPTVSAQRDQVLTLLQRLAPDRAASLTRSSFERIDDTRFVNAFCQAAALPPLEKQQLLEANGVRDRLDQLVSLLQFQLAERSASDAGSSGTVH
jgi:Lon protease-like protein